VPALYGLLKNPPDGLKYAAQKLSAISVLNLNIGIDRPHISDQHWIYFPENQFIFSRIGFPMNFSRAVAPPGTSSMYIEITHAPDKALDVEERSSGRSPTCNAAEFCGIGIASSRGMSWIFSAHMLFSISTAKRICRA
jgi:hypothetical protein